VLEKILLLDVLTCKTSSGQHQDFERDLKMHRDLLERYSEGVPWKLDHRRAAITSAAQVQ